MEKDELKNVLGGILGPRSTEAITKYQACKNAWNHFSLSKGGIFDSEYAWLKQRAHAAYRRGLIAHMSDKYQELDNISLKAMNDYSDYVFDNLK